MWAIRSRHCLIVGMMLAVGAAPLSAQENKDPINVLPFEATDHGVNTCAMIACIGAMPMPGQAHPWGVIGTRLLAGTETVPLTKWQFRFDKVFAINQRYLDLIRDGKSLPDVRGKEFKELAVPDRAVYFAYLDALRHSNRATQEMFDKSAADNRHVVYSHLARAARDYRGKIITIKGKITYIRANEAPRLLQDEGVPFVYSTAIVGPTKGAPPFTVAFTELPRGVGLSERLDREVTFEGYFLAFIRHPADKENGMTTDVVSPWLVGKTLLVNHQGKDAGVEPDDKTATSYYYIAWSVGGIVAVVVLGAVVNFWFRRNDRRIQAQLQDVRDKHHPFNIEPADEPAPGEQGQG